MLVTVVAAMDEARGVGFRGDLPWRLPADMAWFRRVTAGKPLVMGRATHESIGRALPGRRNVVVTRDPAYAPHAGAETAPDPGAALRLCADVGVEEVMAIGGPRLWRAVLPRADRILMTRVHGLFEADAFFPELDPAAWRETWRAFRLADSENATSCSFVELRPA